jgi:hypothetical protein
MRFTAVFLFSRMHGIVDDACLKEKRMARSRPIGRLPRICFGPAGLQSDDIRDGWRPVRNTGCAVETPVALISAPPLTSNAP